jgi:MFS transporter, DHA1 family, staphyloferrin A biosynthesis exporter
MNNELDSKSDDIKGISHDGSHDKVADSVEKVSSFSPLGIRNFRFLFTGTVLSNAGQFIQQVALSWLIYDITGSGTILGSVNVVRAIGSVLMIPVAGFLIDRLNRRKLILIENSWLFLISLVLGITILTGHHNILYLFIFTFLAGIVQTVDMALRQVLIFDLVPRPTAPNAVAILQTGWALMRVAGPALGGFFILWFGPGGNFLVQAGAYILITISILQIKFPEKKYTAVRISPLQNIKAGISYVVKERNTRTFMMMGFIMPIFIIPIFMILPPIYAVEVFGDKSGRILGFLLSSVGVGGFVGGLVTASLGRVERRGLVQVASLFLLSLSLVAFAFSTTLWISLVLLAFSGFFEIVFLITNQTLLQLSIPDKIRGQVTSLVSLNAALSPIGSLIAGAGSDLFGNPKIITIILASVAACITFIVFVFSPTIRNYKLSQAIAADAAITNIDSHS